MENSSLNSVFPNWNKGKGIFYYLNQLPVPWKDSVQSIPLDMEYHGNVSGCKNVSPLLYGMKEDDGVTDEALEMVAMMIFTMFGFSWSKLWDTMSIVYNPIENYSMTEEMKDNETVTEYSGENTRTDDLKHVKTGEEVRTPDTTDTIIQTQSQHKDGNEKHIGDTTDIRTDDLESVKRGTEKQQVTNNEVQTPNLNVKTSNDVYAFNSPLESPTGNQTQISTGTNSNQVDGETTTTYDLSNKDTGTQTHDIDTSETITYDITHSDSGNQTHSLTGTDTMRYDVTDSDSGTQIISNSGNNKTTHQYTLTRSGNIGVTTSQQMIMSERELWKWTFFKDVVFPHLDQILTISIY